MGGNNANLFEEIRTTKKSLSQTSEAIIEAHTTFTNLFNSFLSLSNQLENKFKELEEREIAVEKKEKEVDDKSKQLEEREKTCVDREQKMEEWVEVEKRMKANVDKFPTVVTLNICGSKFAISKEKLLQHQGSLFEQILKTNHSQQLPPANEVYIERDPKYFKFVLRYLVDGKIRYPSKSFKRVAIVTEFAYYKIPFTFPVPIFFPRKIKTVRNTLICDDGDFEGKIKEWLPNRRFQLLYKASKDGFTVQAFHAHCDNKGPTLAVIRSTNGFLFGGFSPLPWNSTTNLGYKNDTDAFIFTLTNPHNIQPTKYLHNKQNEKAIYCHPSYGLTFGGGHDICVADNANQHNNSYTGFPHTYADTTGQGRNTFTGAYHFTASEIEVFSVL